MDPVRLQHPGSQPRWPHQQPLGNGNHKTSPSTWPSPTNSETSQRPAQQSLGVLDTTFGAQWRPSVLQDSEKQRQLFFQFRPNRPELHRWRPPAIFNIQVCLFLPLNMLVICGLVWFFFFVSCSSFCSFAIIACTSEGCITSAHTTITTLEAPPATVEPPRLDSVSSSSMDISWSKPLTQNGEVTEYMLQLNNEQSYRGTDQNTVLSDLQPHTAYQLVLIACTNGGCTTSTPISALTEEAPPTNLPAPTLKVY